ncbi:MAG: lysozyme inhibitor LprI family protein [Motiliproteus sp.]
MKSLLALLLIITLNPAIAGDSQSCYDSAMAQSQLNRCAKLEMQEATATLNQLLTELKSTLPVKPEENLIAAQKAWDDLVTNDCSIESWYLEGGSARSMIVTRCHTNHSRQRIKLLSRLLCHPMKEECEAAEKYQTLP